MKKLLTIVVATSILVVMASSFTFSVVAADDGSLTSLPSFDLVGAGNTRLLGVVNAGEIAAINCDCETACYIQSSGNAYFRYVGYDPDGLIGLKEREHGGWRLSENDGVWFSTTGGRGACSTVIEVYYGSVTITCSGETPAFSVQSGGWEFDYLAKSNYYPSNTVHLDVGEVAHYELVDCQDGYFGTYAYRDDGYVNYRYEDENIAYVDVNGDVYATGEGITHVHVAYLFGPDEDDCFFFVDDLTVVVGDGGACGDVNVDGAVNLKDVLYLRQYLAGTYKTVPLMKTADVNGDGVANMKDVLLLRKYLAGLIRKLGK